MPITSNPPSPHKPLITPLSPQTPHTIPPSLHSFENANALHQLRCGGVLEAVRISCAGFPNKRPFPDFVEHFWPLAPELYHKPELEDRWVGLGVGRGGGWRVVLQGIL